MKLTTPFSILKDVLKNKSPKVISPDQISCSIDEFEVPIKECAVEVEAHMEEPNLDFWDEECEGHPTNSHCKVYDG